MSTTNKDTNVPNLNSIKETVAQPDDNNALLERIAALEEENAKLRKDNVRFAKRIKKAEAAESDIEALKQEVEALKSKPAVASYTKRSMADETPDSEMSLKDLAPRVEVAEYDEEDEEEIPYIQKPVKKVWKVIKGIVLFLLIVVLLIAAVSGTSGILAKFYPSKTIGGYRFYSVVNESMYQENNGNSISMTDVVLVKNDDISTADVDDVILQTVSGRSFSTVKEINTVGSETVLTVSDYTGTYEVDETNYLGIAKSKLPYLGTVVQYASAHPYNYYGYLLAAALILIALLLLLPTSKKKYGVDFTEEDFTI